MPPRPSPLRSAETRERRRTRMTCSPRARRYRERLSLVKIISAVHGDATGTGAGMMTNHDRAMEARNRRGTRLHRRPHVDLAGQLFLDEIDFEYTFGEHSRNISQPTA